MNVVLDTRRRVESAAAGFVSQHGLGPDLADDLAQSVALQQLEGIPVRLDRRGLNWVMHGIIDAWFGRRAAHNVHAAAELMAWRPANIEALTDVQRIYELASEKQRDAMLSLLAHGAYRKGSTRVETMRRSQALYALRTKLEASNVR